MKFKFIAIVWDLSLANIKETYTFSSTVNKANPFPLARQITNF